MTMKSVSEKYHEFLKTFTKNNENSKGLNLLELLLDGGSAETEDDMMRERIDEYITSDSTDVLMLSLKMKISINYVYPNGFTLLHMACRNGFSTLTRHLLMHGASPLIEDGHRFLVPLHLCSQKGHVGCIEVLLSHGVKVDCRHKLSGKLSLHFASQSGSPSAVSLLLSADNENVTVNAVDNDEHTPLHLAVIDGNYDIVQLLLRQKCDVSVKDASNKTALDLARMLERDDIAQAISGETMVAELFCGMRIAASSMIRRLSAVPSGRWVAITDGKIMRSACGQVTVHRSRHAAAMWMSNLFATVQLRNADTYPQNMPIGGNISTYLHRRSSSGVTTCAVAFVAEIAADRWHEFLERFVIKLQEQYGDDPQLDAYKLRVNSHQTSLATCSTEEQDMCDVRVRKRIVQLNDDIDILREAIVSAKRLLSERTVETELLDVERFSSVLANA